MACANGLRPAHRGPLPMRALGLAVKLFEILQQLLDELREGDQLPKGDAMPLKPGHRLLCLGQRPPEFQLQPRFADPGASSVRLTALPHLALSSRNQSCNVAGSHSRPISELSLRSTTTFGLTLRLRGWSTSNAQAAACPLTGTWRRSKVSKKTATSPCAISVMTKAPGTRITANVPPGL